VYTSDRLKVKLSKEKDSYFLLIIKENTASYKFICVAAVTKVKFMFEKIFSFIIILSITASVSLAQVGIEYDSLYTEVIESNDIVAHNFFNNDLPQPIRFRWTRNVIEMTQGWQTAICDNNTCYLPIVSSMEILLGPNDTSILDLHLYPRNIYEGYAYIEVLIEHSDDANINNTAFFFFDSQLTSSNEEVPSLEFDIYPNPSHGLFTIENNVESVSSIRILNVAGQEIQHLAIGNRELINLTNLASGTYLVQLLNGEGRRLETKLISKI